MPKQKADPTLETVIKGTAAHQPPIDLVQELPAYRLALAGVAWPVALDPLGPVLKNLKAGRRHLERHPDAELWIGYASPLILLQQLGSADPGEELQRWARQVERSLELRRAHPGRCHLLNLPLLDGAAIEQLLQEARDDDDDISSPGPSGLSQAFSAPPGPQAKESSVSGELDVRLVLTLQHRRDLHSLYADLEGSCELLGRQPQFVLPLPALRGEALAERCLQSWRRELAALRHAQEEQFSGIDQQLQEAREEAELTLLQLHQVQEELEQMFLDHRQAKADLKAVRQNELNLQAEVEHLRQQNDQLQRQPQELPTPQGELASEAGKELQEAREEAELTLLQLHQVQEELEHYFLEHRKATNDLQALREQLEGLEQEALHLFLHSTPTASLDRSKLELLTEVAREALQLKPPG